MHFNTFLKVYLVLQGLPQITTQEPVGGHRAAVPRSDARAGIAVAGCGPGAVPPDVPGLGER